MKNHYALLVGSMLLFFSAQSQKPIVRCFAHEHLIEQIRQDPERGRKLDVLDKKVDDLIAARAANAGSASQAKRPVTGGPRTNTVYIPVVVNVVYKTAEENISDRQVQSQIAVLNKDFNAANIEVQSQALYDFAGYNNLIADCQIEFVLDRIVRRQTTVSSFSTNDAMKKTASGGLDPTNPTTMLNLWSCNMGGGILGYAQFPGGNAITDGVVILYNAFGTSEAGATAAPYNEGRTATHEIGHWLGLRHIWGDRQCGDDKVGDTPLHNAANFGCPGAGHVSTCKGAATLEQYMNYMDYTDDLCMYMFTKGQLSRIDGYIASSRSAYCLPSIPLTVSKMINPENEQAFNVYPTIVSDVAQMVVFSKITGRGEVLLSAQSGQMVSRKSLALSKGRNTHTIEMSGLPNGIYMLRFKNAEGAILTRKLVVQH